jgi:hypothetical protein
MAQVWRSTWGETFLFLSDGQRRLKHKCGLARSRYRGYERVAAGVGLGIFAHNVRRWAQVQAHD